MLVSLGTRTWAPAYAGLTMTEFTGDAEREVDHAVPGISHLDAFNHAIDPVGSQ
jgi:hypothetical protein